MTQRPRRVARVIRLASADDHRGLADMVTQGLGCCGSWCSHPCALPSVSPPSLGPRHACGWGGDGDADWDYYTRWGGSLLWICVGISLEKRAIGCLEALLARRGEATEASANGGDRGENVGNSNSRLVPVRGPGMLPVSLRGINMPDTSTGQRPTVAAMMWCNRALELFLQAGADPDDGCALAVAVDETRADSVLSLLQAGASTVKECGALENKSPALHRALRIAADSVPYAEGSHLQVTLILKWILSRTSMKDLQQFMQLDRVSRWECPVSCLELGVQCYAKGTLTASDLGRLLCAMPDKRSINDLPDVKAISDDYGEPLPPHHQILIPVDVPYERQQTAPQVATQTVPRPFRALIMKKLKHHNIDGILNEIRNSRPMPRSALSKSYGCIQLVALEAALKHRNIILLKALVTQTDPLRPSSNADPMCLPLDLRGIPLPTFQKKSPLLWALEWGVEPVERLILSGVNPNEGCVLAWAVDICPQAVALLLRLRASSVLAPKKWMKESPYYDFSISRQLSPALVRALSDAPTKQSAVPLLHLLLANTSDDSLEGLCTRDFNERWGYMCNEYGQRMMWKTRPSCLDYAALCFANGRLDSAQFTRFARAAPRCDFDTSQLALPPPGFVPTASFRAIPPSILYLLCEHGCIEGILTLLKRGVNVREVVPPYGETPLHAAAAGNFTEICRLLVESGADCRLRCKAHDDLPAMTPIDYAIKNSNFQLVQFMVNSISASQDLRQYPKEPQIHTSTELSEPTPSPPTKGLCGICLEEGLLLSLSRCSHAFCLDCLGQWFKSNVSTHPRCPMRGCLSVASYYDILASIQNKGAYEERLLQETLSNMLDFARCPKCSYGGLVTCDDAICEGCGFHFCVKCSLQYHRGARCEDISKELFVQEPEARKGNRILEENALSSEWISNNAKPCPRCTQPIEYAGGCNLVACLSCQYYFCWLCRGPSINRSTCDQVDPCGRIPALLQLKIHYETHHPAQILSVCGAIPELGAWDFSKGVNMTRTTIDGDEWWWTVVLNLKVGITFHWLFAVVQTVPTARTATGTTLLIRTEKQTEAFYSDVNYHQQSPLTRYKNEPPFWRYWRVIFQDSEYIAYWDDLSTYNKKRP
ncbi:E3 ubiquitin-protein ligase RNF14 [Pelomyxa schiedti]|nr:E3 ubiquitin-protein ligase RNF14 [Pelomyxa schiedti]